MPELNVDGHELFYLDTGSGPETIVFSHGFLMSHEMYRHQIEALSTCYRVIAFDHRGHGQSAPCRDPFSMSDLVDDAMAVITQLELGPVHFVGMSTGGFVAMRLYLKRPDLIKSLVLIDTSAQAETKEALKQYGKLLWAVRFIGVRPLLGKVFPLLFASKFLLDSNRKGEVHAWRKYMGGLDKISIRNFGRAIFSRSSVLTDLENRTDQPPVLILVGNEDVPTPVVQAKALSSAFRRSELQIIPNSGHTSPVEVPQMVTGHLSKFLERIIK